MLLFATAVKDAGWSQRSVDKDAVPASPEVDDNVDGGLHVEVQVNVAVNVSLAGRGRVHGNVDVGRVTRWITSWR
jgi:hypothetical protein